MLQTPWLVNLTRWMARYRFLDTQIIVMKKRFVIAAWTLLSLNYTTLHSRAQLGFRKNSSWGQFSMNGLCQRLLTGNKAFSTAWICSFHSCTSFSQLIDFWNNIVNSQLGFQRPVHFAFHVETKRKNYDIKHYLTATAKVTNNPTVSSKHEQKSKRLAFEGFVVIITNLACQVSHCSSSTARL